MSAEDTPSADGEVDPTEFLRALLKISPEDAAKARESAAKQMEREDRERVTEASREGDTSAT